MTPAENARTPCPHCPDDGHGNPLRRSWGVYVAATQDGDGQPTTLHVSPSNGAHVAESDAEWLRTLIEGDQTSATQIVDELLGPLQAQIGVAEYEQSQADQRAQAASATLARVRALAEKWAVAPADDWANEIPFADAGRAVLAALDGEAGT